MKKTAEKTSGEDYSKWPIKYFRFDNGESVVARLGGVEKDRMWIYRPTKISTDISSTGRTLLLIYPWLPLAVIETGGNNDVVIINPNIVMCMTDVREDMQNYYNKYAESLYTEPRNLSAGEAEDIEKEQEKFTEMGDLGTIKKTMN